MITIDLSKVTKKQWFWFVFLWMLGASFGGGLGQFLADKTIALF
jgi:hypothetical protein